MGILRHSCPSYPVPDLPIERRESLCCCHLFYPVHLPSFWDSGDRSLEGKQCWLGL